MDARTLQSGSAARASAMARFQEWGAKNLIRVTNPGGAVLTEVSGYIGLITAIAGLTPAEISKCLGLRYEDLSQGAMIYRLNRIPLSTEFEVRGYTTLPDGLPLPAGQTQDAAGYRAGWGAWQVVLISPVPATYMGRLGPHDRFDIRTLRL